MIATVIAVTDRPAEARSRAAAGEAAPAKPARAPSASGTGTGGATVTRFPQAAPRCAGRWRAAVARRWRAGARTARGQGRPPRERFRGQGTQGPRATTSGRDPRQIATRVAGATRAAATKADAIATRRPRERPVAPAICHQRRPARARSSGRSQFAVRQTGGAQGTAHRQPQGLKRLSSDRSETRRIFDGVAWSASVSINGCGMRGW